MKTFIAALFGAGIAACGLSSAQAMPIAPLGGAQDSLIEHVAQGCGRGYVRDMRGFCRPGYVAPRYAPARPVYVAPRRPVYFAPAPRPVYVAPRRPVIVAPAPRPVYVAPSRACPRGYVLTPRGNCRPRY